MKLKAEIARRATGTAKQLDLEAKKLAVGEMVLEHLETIIELLNAAGFKVASVTTQKPSAPGNTVILPASEIQPQTIDPVKNPCVVCGKESALAEDLPDGTRKMYCRPHGEARGREKVEEQVANDLFHGNTGTMYPRPVKQGPPAEKLVIQAPPAPPPPTTSAADLLKGPFPNGGPPPNSVLDE